jgi:hypothetical protein
LGWRVAHITGFGTRVVSIRIHGAAHFILNPVPKTEPKTVSQDPTVEEFVLCVFAFVLALTTCLTADVECLGRVLSITKGCLLLGSGCQPYAWFMLVCTWSKELSLTIVIACVNLGLRRTNQRQGDQEEKAPHGQGGM